MSAIIMPQQSAPTVDWVAPSVAETQSVMSRPRPGTRRFYLDRQDVDQLCGRRIANRLRQRTVSGIVAARHSACAQQVKA